MLLPKIKKMKAPIVDNLTSYPHFYIFNLSDAIVLRDFLYLCSRL